MVDRVYSRLDEGNLRRAIARLPGAACPAGVTRDATDEDTDGSDGAIIRTSKTADP